MSKRSNMSSAVPMNRALTLSKAYKSHNEKLVNHQICFYRKWASNQILLWEVLWGLTLRLFARSAPLSIPELVTFAIILLSTCDALKPAPTKRLLVQAPALLKSAWFLRACNMSACQASLSHWSDEWALTPPTCQKRTRNCQGLSGERKQYNMKQYSTSLLEHHHASIRYPQIWKIHSPFKPARANRLLAELPTAKQKLQLDYICLCKTRPLDIGFARVHTQPSVLKGLLASRLPVPTNQTTYLFFLIKLSHFLTI